MQQKKTVLFFSIKKLLKIFKFLIIILRLIFNNVFSNKHKKSPLSESNR